MLFAFAICLAEAGEEVQILTLFRGKSGAGEVNAVMHARVPKDIARLTYPVEIAVGEPVIFGKNDPKLDLPEWLNWHRS